MHMLGFQLSVTAVDHALCDHSRTERRGCKVHNVAGRRHIGLRMRGITDGFVVPSELNDLVVSR